MSSSNMQIVLDREDRSYHFGEQVSGKVILNPDRKLSYRKIVLNSGWRTHGKGNVDKGERDITILDGKDTLDKGVQRVYPFTFTAPNGPVTYHGFYVNVDWYLTAQVDIPLAPDITEEEDFILLPSETPGIIILGNADLSEIQPPTRQRHVPPVSSVSQGVLVDKLPRTRLFKWGKTLTWVAIALPLLMLVFFVIGILQYPDLNAAFTLILAPLVIFAGVLIYVGVQVVSDVIAKFRLDFRDVRIKPEEVYAGEQLSCHLNFQTKGTVYLDSITAELFAEESAVSGGGTYVTVNNFTVYHEHFIKTYRESLTAGRQMSFDCVIPIDSSAPATFSSNNNKVRWIVIIKINFRGWYAWTKRLPITVLPAYMGMELPIAA